MMRTKAERAQELIEGIMDCYMDMDEWLKSVEQYGYELTPEEWEHIKAMREIFRRLEREIGGTSR